MSEWLSFETLKKHYAYDSSAPLDAEFREAGTVEGGRAYEVTFRSADGLVAYADVIVPDRDGPYPLLIAPDYMAGLDPARHGVLSAWMEYRLAGRDQREGLVASYAETPGTLLWARVQTVLAFRRLLDLLFGRYDINKERVCYMGASKGGMMGTILGAVDGRVRQFVIRAAGADLALMARDSEDHRMKTLVNTPWYTDEFLNTMMAPWDCQHFVHRLAPRPVLFECALITCVLLLHFTHAWKGLFFGCHSVQPSAFSTWWLFFANSAWIFSNSMS